MITRDPFNTYFTQRVADLVRNLLVASMRRKNFYLKMPSRVQKFQEVAEDTPPPPAKIIIQDEKFGSTFSDLMSEVLRRISH